jgi:lysophospholipase L1-like esterase
MKTEQSSEMRRGRWRRIAISIAVFSCAMLVGGETIARRGLGLGDPPLHVAFPGIEYAFRAGTYRRFGNTIRINSHHMRSEEIPPRKSSPEEVRVMIMGDSVINGGALTDQSDLASERIQRDLQDKVQVPVVVGNISAGSWGPGNLLAYARRFGLFEADLVVIVLNSEDASDNPTGEPIVGIHHSFPAQRPWTALGEGFTRYVWPRFHWLQTSARSAEPPRDEAAETAKGIQDLTDLCDLVASQGIATLIVHFPNRSELSGNMLPGYSAIAEMARHKGIPLIEVAPALADALKAGSDPYQPNDQIHPNALGQRIIAATLLPRIVENLDGKRPYFLGTGSGSPR